MLFITMKKSLRFLFLKNYAIKSRALRSLELHCNLYLEMETKVMTAQSDSNFQSIYCFIFEHIQIRSDPGISGRIRITGLYCHR